jgi:hypothetical protein
MTLLFEKSLEKLTSFLFEVICADAEIDRIIKDPFFTIRS